MRTLQQWARQLPKALQEMPSTALDEVRSTADEAARLAHEHVRSVRVEPTHDGAEVKTDDPRASVLERIRYRYIGDAVDAARRDLPDRLTRRWTEDLTDG